MVTAKMTIAGELIGIDNAILTAICHLHADSPPLTARDDFQAALSIRHKKNLLNDTA